MPTWGWYAIGLFAFVGIYLYVHTYKTTNPIGGTVVVPNTDALIANAGNLAIFTQLLSSTQQDFQQLGIPYPPRDNSNAASH